MALQNAEAMKSLRWWSWTLWGLSFAPVAYFIYQNWLFSKWAQQQSGNGTFVCGTGIFVLAMGCIALSAAFSVSGALLGVASYFKVQRPRPQRRMLELALLGVVPLAFCVFLAALFSL